MKKVLPLALSLLPVLALAGGIDNAIDSVGGILQSLVPLIIGLAVVLFLWGVLKYVASGDSEDKKKAREMMIYGIIAIFVMVSVWGLVNLLGDTFSLSNSTPDVPDLP